MNRTKSLNSDPSELERQPLLSVERPASRFHAHVEGEKKCALLDTIVLVVYLLHLIGLILLSVYVLKQPKHPHSESVQREFRWFLIFAGAGCAGALLLSPLVLILAYYRTAYIAFSLLGVAGMSGNVAMAFKYLPFPSCGVLHFAALFGLLVAIILCCVEMRYGERFVSEGRIAATVVAFRPFSLVLNIVTLLVNGVVICFGLFLTHHVFIRFSGWRAILLAVATGLSTAWNARVVSFIGYMTCCGSFASWYFSLTPEASRLPYATLKAFARAISTSLGALALASFLFALSAILQAVLLLLKKFKSSCAKKARKEVHAYVNTYAIVHMALWGDSFLRASRSAKLATQHFHDMETPLTVLLVTFSLATSSIASAVALGLTSTLYADSDFHGLPRTTYLVLVYIFVMLIVFWISWTAIQPMHAATTSIFFCFCEDPFPLQHADTEFVTLLHSKGMKIPTTTSAIAATTATSNTAAKKAARANAASSIRTKKTMAIGVNDKTRAPSSQTKKQLVNTAMVQIDASSVSTERHV